MKKFLKEYAPESEELKYFEDLDKPKVQQSQTQEEVKNQSQKACTTVGWHVPCQAATALLQINEESQI